MLGFEVTLIEKLDQVLGPLDPEFARLVEDHVERHGVHLALNDGVAGFKQLDGGAIEVQTKSGKTYPADIVILAIGVRPDTTLAKTAGLEIGERGGIRVDDQMRTSDPDIFAVGDAIEVKDFVTGQWSLVALAGPANRQGRIAADVIAGRDSRYRGTQGTSIIGLFGGAAAWTGVSEKTLKRLGDKDYEKIYLFPNSHAGYYPGAKMLGLKVIFRKSDGRLLGRAGARRGRTGGGQADQRPGRGHPDGRDDLRPRGGRALLRAPVRQREGRGQLRRDGRRRRPARRHAARPLGRTPRARSCSTCASRWSWSWRACRARSTSRWRSSARASASCRATARSSSSAAPPSAPTTRRASCCRTASRPGTSPAACCRARCCWVKGIEMARRAALLFGIVSGFTVFLVAAPAVSGDAQPPAADRTTTAPSAEDANNPLAKFQAFNVHDYYVPALSELDDQNANTFWFRYAQPFGKWLFRASLPMPRVPTDVGTPRRVWATSMHSPHTSSTLAIPG